MPVYEFKCNCCGVVVEVVNRMADSHLPPEDRCECGESSWEKHISANSYRWRFVDKAPTEGE